MNRRAFLKSVGAAAAGLSLPIPGQAKDEYPWQPDQYDPNRLGTEVIRRCRDVGKSSISWAIDYQTATGYGIITQTWLNPPQEPCAEVFKQIKDIPEERKTTMAIRLLQLQGVNIENPASIVHLRFMWHLRKPQKAGSWAKWCGPEGSNMPIIVKRIEY